MKSVKLRINLILTPTEKTTIHSNLERMVQLAVRGALLATDLNLPNQRVLVERDETDDSDPQSECGCDECERVKFKRVTCSTSEEIPGLASIPVTSDEVAKLKAGMLRGKAVKA